MDMNEMQKVRKSDILLIAIKHAMFDQDMSNDSQTVLRDQFDDAPDKKEFDCILRVGNQIDADEIDWHISFIIRHLNIPPHIKGYKYLRDAIKMVIVADNEDDVSYITKSIYPDLAKKYNTTAAGVERGIRHSIEQIRFASYLRKMIYLGSNKLSYTNKEVILGIADCIKYGGGETRFRIIENDESNTADNNDSEEYYEDTESGTDSFEPLPAV